MKTIGNGECVEKKKIPNNSFLALQIEGNV